MRHSTVIPNQFLKPKIGPENLKFHKNQKKSPTHSENPVVLLGQIGAIARRTYGPIRRGDVAQKLGTPQRSAILYESWWERGGFTGRASVPCFNVVKTGRGFTRGASQRSAAKAVIMTLEDEVKAALVVSNQMKKRVCTVCGLTSGRHRGRRFCRDHVNLQMIVVDNSSSGSSMNDNADPEELRSIEQVEYELTRIYEAPAESQGTSPSPWGTGNCGGKTKINWLWHKHVVQL